MGAEEAAQDKERQEERARDVWKETERLRQQEEKLHAEEGCLRA